MITFALIDKYAIVRTGIDLFLKTHFEEISILESENIAELQDKYSNHIPDVVILGISQSSEIQNIGLIKAVKKRYSSANIIMYDEAPEKILYLNQQTQPDPSNSIMVLNYLREGVNGYLTKMNNLADLLTCVRDVLDGKRYISSEVYEMLIYHDAYYNKVLAKINTLSTREYEIANYLLEGLSTNKIALKVGRKATTISTIKNNIYKKLDVDNVMKLQKVFHIMPVSTASS